MKPSILIIDDEKNIRRTFQMVLKTEGFEVYTAADAEAGLKTATAEAPDVVVLGGGLVEAMPELYLGAVEERLREQVMPAFRDRFEIKVAELGDDATTRGAGAWAATVAKESAK